jgi:PAS domain S-box-containing protein
MIRRGLNFALRDLRDTLGSHPVAILAGVGVILVALLIMVAVTLLAENAAESRRDELADEVEPLAGNLAGLETSLLKLSTDLRGFVLTGDPMFRERYLSGRSDVTSRLDEVTEVAERAGFGAETRAVTADTLAYASSADATFEAAERGDEAEAERLIRDENTVRLEGASQAIGAVQETVGIKAANLRDRIREIDTVERYTLFLAGPLGIIAAAVLVWLALTNQRLLRIARAEEARFVSMMTSLSRHGICQLNSRGVIEYCNRAAGEMLGYSLDQLIGRSLHEAAHYMRADGSPCLRRECSLYRGLSSGKSYKVQDSLLRADKSFLPVDITSEPIIVKGRPAGAVIVFEDISQRLRQEQFREQFVSFASHELRTPLMIIGGFAQMLQKKAEADPDAFDENSREAIDELVEGAARMRRITEIVLDLTRIQSGAGLDVEPDIIDIRELLGTEIEMLRSKHTDAQFEATYPPGDLVIQSDQERVRQVLFNLLDNAAKYGGEPPQVNLTVAANASKLTIRVRDNGRGIPPEEQEQIFDRFYRGTTAAGKGGLGVGLYITKRIVDRLGGTLTCESQNGPGTEFTLVLPLTRPSGNRPSR